MTGLAPTFKLPAGVARPDAPIESRDELVGHFVAGAKGGGRTPVQLVGVELERLPVLADATAAPHEGDQSVTALLLALAGGDLEPLVAEGHVLGLRGPGSQVHLEPGAQVELALPPRRLASEVLDDLIDWQDSLRRAARSTGVHVVGMGLQPVTPVAAIGWIPKERYRIMRDHLGARGRLAHHMMKATAGVQFNLDYQDEADAARIVRRALAAAPFLNAACAASPLEEGRSNGFLTKRPRIWLETDPDRVGLLPWVHERGFSFDAYADWALGVPVMFVVRDESWVRMGTMTFGQFLTDGHPSAGRARHDDWALHLTTLFPEVRIKQHVEIRGTDSCRPELAAAVAALWRGLLYDEEAGRGVDALTDGLSTKERADLHEATGRHGLRASAQGRLAGDWLLSLVDLAESGLRRLDGPSSSDVPVLATLREVASSGRTRAEDVLLDWSARGPAAVLAQL